MAKKVNKKFLIGLVAAIGGLAVVAFGLVILSRHSAKFYANRAESELARGDLQAASGDFAHAVSKDRGNKELYIKLGDVYDQMVPQDPAFLSKAVGVWRMVLEMDPGYIPAIDRVLGERLDEMKAGSNDPASFAELRRVAEAAVKADPQNPKYQAVLHIADLRQWIYGAALANDVVTRDIAALTENAQKNPDDADAGFWAAEAQVKQSRDLSLRGKPDQAHTLLDQVLARQQSLCKSRPQNASVQLRSYEVYSQMSMLDDRADRKAAYKDLRRQTITAAHAHAVASDDLYDDVQLIYAGWLAAQNAPRADLEKIYREWAKARPADLRARVALAEFLGADPAQRAEAVQLLSAPMPAGSGARGFPAIVARKSQRDAVLALNSLRVEDARTATGKDRAELIARIKDDLARIGAMGFAEDYPLLKLRGKVQMLDNNPVEAVKSFEKARTLLGSAFDGDLWANQEQAYLVTGQTGTAAQMLEQLVARMPQNLPARLRLAELYLNAGDVEEAAAQLDKVDAAASKTPDVAAAAQRLRVAVLVRQNHSDQARQQLANLPEQSRTDRILKARVAADAGDSSEALRLYNAVLKENPADGEAVAALVDTYLRENNQPQAQQVVAGALKVRPQDNGLLALRDRLAAGTPEQLQKWLDATIRNTPDPLVRDLRLAQIAMARGNFDEAGHQLDEAEKIKADDPRVMDVRLQWYMRQRKFDQARPLVERAAAANADRMDGLAIRLRFALEQGDVASAIKWGNDLVGKHGEFGVNWLLLGKAQQAAARYSDAIASYDAALSRQPNSVEAMRFKAACLESLGRFADEKTALDAAARLAPDDVNVRDQGLNFELHHGDPDKVIASCQDLLKRDPNNAAVFAALGQALEVTAQSKYRGDPAKSRQYMERARDVLNQGMSKFANTTEAVRFYAPLAAAMEGLGDAPGAQKLLQQFAALPAQKDSPAAARELAMFYERNGRAAEAEQAWRDAYARSGNGVDLELELASFLTRQRRVDDALKVLEANASNPRVVSRRIESLMSAGRLADARKIVDQTLATTPSDQPAIYYRGVLELAQGEVQPAISDLTSLRNKDPQNAQVRLWLARALLARGRRDDAIVELEAALQRYPLHDDVRLALLEAYSSGDSPRWGDFDRVVQEAEANPILSSNPQWHQVAATGLARRNAFDQAIQQINTARKLAPNSYLLWQDYVSILAQSRNWQAVLNETDQQLAAGHKEGVVYGQRGLARAGMGDKAAALKEFDAGLAADAAAGNSNGVVSLLRLMGQTVSPDEALARLAKFPAGPGRDLLAMELYELKGDSAAQAKAAESALSQPDKLSNEQRTTALQSQAAAYLRLSQWEKARQAFVELLKLRPDDISTLNNIAYLEAEMLNDPQAAKPYSGHAYDLAMRSGGIPSIADTHGWVLTLCGGRDATAGLGILQNLVETDQNFTKARYHLAEAYLRKGNFQAAGDQLAVVQQQLKQMQQNHQPVDNELQTGVQKALEQVQQKSGLKGSASSR